MAFKQKPVVAVGLLFLVLIISVQCMDDQPGSSPTAESRGDSMYFSCHHDGDCFLPCSFRFGGVCNTHWFSRNTCSCNECRVDGDCYRLCGYGGICNHHWSSGTTCNCH